MIFYVGLHHPSAAAHFERAFVSVNVVRGRKKPVPSPEWIMDSGAFTEISTFGKYRHDPAVYAAEVERLAKINPGMIAAVAQDFMCEPWIVARTGLSVDEHQRLTIERFDALRPLVKSVELIPVLQGFRVEDYLRHVEAYGDRLARGAFVGVGSVCKRNKNVAQVEMVLSAIKIRRPDLRLHGFGIKTTALASGMVRDCLYSADSMAWSFRARREGRNPNDWREALAFVRRIETMPVQNVLSLESARGP